MAEAKNATSSIAGSDDLEAEQKKIFRANRIIKIFGQITECLEDDEVAKINWMLLQAMEICGQNKTKDDEAIKKLNTLYTKYLLMVEYRAGISVNLIKQSIRAFLMIEDDPDDLGKLVHKKFLEMILQEHPSLAIDMKLTDDLLKTYFRLLSQGYEEAMHIRLMVVGMYGVGKTSLIRRLCKKRIDDVKSTVGIDISVDTCEVNENGDWEISDPSKKEKFLNIRLQELLKKYHEHDSGQNNQVQNAPTNTPNPSQHNQAIIPGPTLAPLPSFKEFSKKVTLEDQKHEDRDASEHTVRSVMDDLKEISKPVTSEQDEDDIKRRPTVSIWDFAGQSVYYSTHHFFLNARSIYILVLDISKNLHEVVKEDKNLHEVVKEDKSIETYPNLILGNTTKGYTCLDAFKFWMKSISIYTRQGKTQSQEEEYKPTILLVGTHGDKVTEEKLAGRSLDVYKEDYFDEALEAFIDTSVLELVHDKRFVINNKDSIGDQFCSIREEIFKISKEGPFLKEKVPAKFIPLEREVFQKKKNGDFLMRFADLQHVGKDLEYPQSEEEEIKLFLRFQHAFGNVLHYDTDGLSDLIILTPQWIIDVFKAFVTHKPDRKSTMLKSWKDFRDHGQLKEDLIDYLLKRSEFLHQKQEILHYMEYMEVIAKPVEFKEELHEQEVLDGTTQKKLADYYFIDKTKRKETEKQDFYIMPCMLPPRPDVELLKALFSDRNDTLHTPSLCLYIKGGLLPAFVLHRIIASALKEMPLCVANGKKLLFNGLGSFKVTPTTQLTMWTIDNIIHLRVSFKTENLNFGEKQLFCKGLRNRFEELILTIFSFHHKETYTKENRHDLYDLHVKCPKCFEQTPFDQKIDEITERPIDYMISLLDVENLQACKAVECGCCNNIVTEKEALEFWFTDEDERKETNAELTEYEDNLLLQIPTEDNHLVEIAKSVKDFRKLAYLLKLSESDLERLDLDRLKANKMAYYILYQWKKRGECWKKLYTALKKSGFDTQNFFNIIEGKLSNEEQQKIEDRYNSIITGHSNQNDIFTDERIAELVKCIGDEYWYLGIRLGISESEMQIMRLDSSDSKTHIRKILQSWKKACRPIEEFIRAATLCSCEWGKVRDVLIK